MKRFVVGSTFVALLTVSAGAQDELKEAKFKIAADGKAQIEMAKAIGAGHMIEMKVVKDAPYSATAESETVQMLADGNRIRNKNTTNVARDSEGRTRREIVGTTPGIPAQVFINDPVGDVTYSLNPKQRIAVKSQRYTLVAKQATEVNAKTATVTPNGQSAKIEQLDATQRTLLEQKLARAKAETTTEVKIAGGSLGGGVIKRNPGQTESLGQQMIEGVMCEGKRTIITIPADTIGNDLPINTVLEEWYSPELQVLVLTKQSDPRHGETTYRLTHINRSEPPRALFEVPADYTVEEPFRSVLKKVKEEQ